MTNTPVIIVTGASRGLGAAIAIWLAKAGCRIVLMARSGKDLQTVAAQADRMGAAATLPIAADVGDATACWAAAAQTAKAFGQIDALINNAGTIDPLGPVASIAPDQLQTAWGVNFGGPFYLTQACLSYLRPQGGRIINVSSGAAVAVIRGAAAYCAAKAALNHFTAVLAAEEPRLTVVAVRPGVVDTDMQTVLRRRGPQTMPASEAQYYQNIKDTGQLLAPEEPGRRIAWLGLHAPPELSGRFIDHDDPQITASADQWPADEKEPI